MILPCSCVLPPCPQNLNSLNPCQHLDGSLIVQCLATRWTETCNLSQFMEPSYKLCRYDRSKRNKLWIITATSTTFMEIILCPVHLVRLWCLFVASGDDNVSLDPFCGPTALYMVLHCKSPSLHSLDFLIFKIPT